VCPCLRVYRLNSILIWVDGLRPESNLGPADNPNLSSPALSSTELWWQMHHRILVGPSSMYPQKGPLYIRKRSMYISTRETCIFLKKLTLPTALSHQWFGPPIFFSKTFIFSIIFYSTLQISGGGHFRKSCRSRKKESKPSEITCKQLEPARTISKIEKRREFVRALCNEQSPKNSFKRLYIAKGLLLFVEKTSFA